MVRYNVFKDGVLKMESVTAKQIAKITGCKEKYIAGLVSTYGGYCKNLYIEKTRDSLTKYEILEFEWDREIEDIRNLFRRAYRKRKIVTSSARSYR